MPKVELTDRFCQSAKPMDGTKTDYFDTVVKGLCLRASKEGTRTFFLVYTKPTDGKRAWIKLGTYPDIKLGGENGARDRARNFRADIGDGADPVEEKKAAEATQTVSQLVENYIVRHAATKRSGDAIARRLRKNVAGTIGAIKLSDLHRRDITKCIDTVKDRGAHTEANRIFEDLRAMIRWARARGDLDDNLVEGMKKPTETEARDRVLAADEISTMWKALPDTDMRESTRRVVRLCLVTAQRVGEVSGMTRAELDLDSAVWVIPAARSKNKREHTVPLSAMAIGIIRDQLAEVDALSERKGRAVPTFVFPAPGGRAAVSGGAIAKAIRRQEIIKAKRATIMGIAQWTAHDLRRTAATHMEELGISPFIIGHVLNHVSATQASITSRVYARYDYGQEKRQALELWADRLAAIIGGKDNVKPFTKRAA